MPQKNLKPCKKMPVLTLWTLKWLRQGTNAIITMIKKDKFSPTVFSQYDISYVKNGNALQKFDWHCPKKIMGDTLSPTPTIFYIHGGAWASADKKIYTRLCKDFCERDFVVININYRLIPEVTLEDTYEDCLKAIKFCLKNSAKFGIDKDKLIIGGDSAGAHLAALIAGKVSMNKLFLNGKIVGTVLLYGLFNLNHMADSKFAILPPLHKGFKASKCLNLKRFYHDYSPIYYVTDKFPPSFLSAGKIDNISAETIEFLEVLKQKGVKTQSIIFPADRKDARHAFINLNNPARQETVMAIGKSLLDFIK